MYLLVPTVPAAKAEPKGPARAVVRMERKGRGGKKVTVVEQLELRPREGAQALAHGSELPDLDCPLLAEMALPLTMVASDLHQPVHHPEPMHHNEEAPAPQPRETGASF